MTHGRGATNVPFYRVGYGVARLCGDGYEVRVRLCWQLVTRYSRGKMEIPSPNVTLRCAVFGDKGCNREGRKEPVRTGITPLEATVSTEHIVKAYR